MKNTRKTSRRRRNRKVGAMLAIFVLLALCAAVITGIVLLLQNAANNGDDPSSSRTSTPTSATTTTEPSSTTTTTTTRPLQFVDGHYVQQGTPEWNLVLVNQWNWLDATYYDTLVDEYIETFSTHGQMDKRVHDALRQMTEAAHEAGYTGLYGLYLFRTVERSESNWSRRVNNLLSQGYSQAEAERIAQSIQARGYTSEHNAGLAADMVCYGYEDLPESFEDTPEFSWLIKNCHKYGFILRYPKDKQDITGVIYEPWHYRYVGVEAATEIMARGICLEEYLAEKGI